MDIVDLLKKRSDEIGDEWGDHDLLLKAAEEINRLLEALASIAAMYNIDARVHEDRASGNEAARMAQSALTPNAKRLPRSHR